MKKIILIAGLCALVAVSVIPAFALALEYTPLAPIPTPGPGDAEGAPIYTSQSGLGVFLVNVFRIGIAAAGALAVLMIIWGGFQYMTSEVIGSKQAGKEKIQAALLGLLLAFSAFLIMRTIHPTAFTTFDVVNERSPAGTTGGGGGSGTSEGGNPPPVSSPYLTRLAQTTDGAKADEALAAQYFAKAEELRETFPDLAAEYENAAIQLKIRSGQIRNFIAVDTIIKSHAWDEGPAETDTGIIAWLGIDVALPLEGVQNRLNEYTGTTISRAEAVPLYEIVNDFYYKMSKVIQDHYNEKIEGTDAAGLSSSQQQQLKDLLKTYVISFNNEIARLIEP